MRALEDFNVMESFGLMPDGIFSEVSEIDMVDVIGGSCGAGAMSTCWYVPNPFPGPFSIPGFF